MLSPKLFRGARPAINRLRIPSSVPRGPRLTSSLARPRHASSSKLSPILALRTQFSTKPPLQPNKIDKEHEKELGQQQLEARPDEVSTQSSVRHIVEPSQAPPVDRDMTADIENDINTIKETFDLGEVPREPYLLGLAGTLPYLATSLSTVFLSWNMNTQWPTDSSLLNSILFSNEAASHYLHILEPLQVGYGAVIISFLGAIHWGLEFAERQTLSNRARFRYTIGVIAPLVAWPTTLMSIEFALTTQFLAFVSLYFVDSRAMARGWAPTWYQTYRFVLTAVVGAAILISLVSRTKIGASHARLSSPELKDLLSQKSPGEQEYHNWEKEEEEERKRLREEKKRKEEEEKKQKEEEEKKKKAEKKSKDKGDKKKKDSKEEDKKENKMDDKPEEKKDNKDNKEKKNDKPEENNEKEDDKKEAKDDDKKEKKDDKKEAKDDDKKEKKVEKKEAKDDDKKEQKDDKKDGGDTKKRDQEDKRAKKDGKESGKQTSKKNDDEDR